MTDPPLPSGWFPDPLDRYDHRWFNGTTWTSDVSVDGQRRIDPLGLTPSHDTATPAADGKGNGSATAAVVCGSIAVVIAWIPFIAVIGAVLTVLALVFGVRGLRRSRTAGTGRVASIAGIVMGVLGIGATVVGAILTVITFRAVLDFIEPGPVVTEITSCNRDGRRVDVGGTLTNRDDERHDYVLFVEIDGRTGSVPLDGVDPGVTVEWSTSLSGSATSDDCDPNIVVNGPFPFGIEIDPVET